ncbi:MAG: crossover junction endodeoxyribonuclease RuvC [Myxococcales bacterium]|nr:crossover junction endodeoxyribonuclease RuvC [Myxococcales bacterium]
MIVLGVDPGSVRTGWGVIESRGARLTVIDAGVIRAGSDPPLEQRLCVIHARLCELIAHHGPSCMAVEDVFSKHARSALKLGQARGVVLLAGAQAQLPISAYPPALVKRSIAGSGAAPKEQLGRIVATILGLSKPPPADASDALAIAITHANAARVRMPRPA